ncbi:MAG: diaminopimelate epimerase [Phycisphaerales bacterium]
MKFVKMHGIGNDYVYIDAYGRPEIERRFAGTTGKAMIRHMSDRHTGIGSDGVILVCRPAPGDAAHVRMRMFNADGSEGIMCGNGIRCVAKFAHDRLKLRANPMRVQTRRGTLSIDYRASRHGVTEATVDMGEPILEPSEIPVRTSSLTVEGATHRWGIVLDQLNLGFVATFVSMGNPHAVVFEDGREEFTRQTLASVDLARIGPVFERHAAFPDRINVHFAAPLGRSRVVMRTWERGSGTTQACGTGACAVLVAGVLTGRLNRRATLELPGGSLRVHWDQRTNHVFMTGPAAEVFEGEWP